MINKVRLEHGVLAIVVLALLATFIGPSLTADAQTSGTITTQLDFGSRGANVTRLQTFLATNAMIYPQGLVTGYFGPLTRAAVVQFQLAFGISPVGRVGPITMNKLNSLILLGGSLDVSAPTISGVNVNPSSSSATVNWGTNEQARAKVFFSTSPISMSEVGNGQASVGGTSVDGGASATSHSVVVTNLNPGTTYFYAVQSTDASGNVSVSWPASFRTN